MGTLFGCCRSNALHRKQFAAIRRRFGGRGVMSDKQIDLVSSGKEDVSSTEGGGRTVYVSSLTMQEWKIYWKLANWLFSSEIVSA